MGLARPVLELLARSHLDYGLEGPVLTLGVQEIDAGREELLELLGRAGVKVRNEPGAEVQDSVSPEEFFKWLGINGYESLDLLPGEGASLIHDLTKPIPTAWRGKFSLLVDGGTVEHVFDPAMREFYSLAKIVFIGKSLTVGGGQNMIESAYFSKPTIVGPLTQNFKDVVNIFKKSDALIEVQDEEQLSNEILALLGDPGRAQKIGEAAKQTVNEYQGSTTQTVDAITNILGQTA